MFRSIAKRRASLQVFHRSYHYGTQVVYPLNLDNRQPRFSILGNKLCGNKLGNLDSNVRGIGDNFENKQVAGLTQYCAHELHSVSLDRRKGLCRFQSLIVVYVQLAMRLVTLSVLLSLEHILRKRRELRSGSDC